MRTKSKTVPLRREPKAVTAKWHEMERCCFCRKRTPFWTALADRTPGEQVACCETCAAAKSPAQVPTKKDWFDKEARLEVTW